MRTRSSLPIVIVLAVVLLVGCRSQRADTEPQPATTQLAATATALPPKTAATGEADGEAPSQEETGETAVDQQGAGDENSPGEMKPITSARTVEEVESINSYRLQIEMGTNAQEAPMMVADGLYVKEPEAEQLTMVITERGEEMTLGTRLVNGVRYYGVNDTWAENERFDLSEMTVIMPSDVVGIVGEMETVGVEEIGGRQAVHLRGDRTIMPFVQSGSDSMDFTQIDEAQLDLWVDQQEGIIIQMHLTGADGEGEKREEFNIRFTYSDFNQPMQISPPSVAENVPTPTPLPASAIKDLFGFEFPLPDGSTLTIYGATANILAPISVAEGQKILVETLTANGFTQVGEAEERAANEFFYTFQRGGQTFTANVFSVVAGKTTIQLGAVK